MLEKEILRNYIESNGEMRDAVDQLDEERWLKEIYIKE